MPQARLTADEVRSLAMEAPRRALDAASVLCQALEAEGGDVVGGRLVQVVAHLACMQLEAAEELLSALEVPVSTGTAEHKVDWLQCRAVLLRDRGRYDEALESAMMALAGLDRRGGDDAIRRARTLNLLGQVFSITGDHEGALHYYGAAFQHLSERGSPGARASVANNVGRVHRDLGDLSSAEHWFRRGLSLVGEETPTYLGAVMLGNLAQVYTEHGRAEDALELLQRALSMCRSLDSTRGIATMLHNLGVGHFTLAQYALARPLLEEAQRLRRGLGEAQDEAESRIHLALVDARLGKSEEALLSLRCLLAAWEGRPTSRVAISCLHSIYLLHREREEFREALEAHERYVAAKALHLDERGRSQLRALEVRYRLDQLQTDIRKVHARAQDLELLSQRDALTGVLNRGALDRAVRDAVEKAERSGSPLCVLFVDFDHFKRINDTHSHAVGDQVLRRGAQLLLGQIRDSDVLGRYGGEEFVCLLPGADLSAGVRVAERMRAQVACERWGTIAPGMSATCSLGVAELRQGEAPDHLLGRADRALMEAKVHRNRVAVAP